MADKQRPWGVQWRSKPSFTILTVAFGLFTDLLLYSIIVPVLPFLLRDRIHVPLDQIQSYTSRLLAAYAASSVLFSVPAGWITDRLNSRQPPFLAGLVLLFISTAIFAFGESIAVLAIARCFQGMAVAVVWTVGLAMVQDTVGPKHMGQAIGTIFSVISVGEAVGPILGGFLYDSAGIIAVFAFSMGMLAVDFIMRLLLIDNSSATTYDAPCNRDDPYSSEHASQGRAAPDARVAREGDPLLPKAEDDEYKIRNSLGCLTRAVPILYCFRNPRLLIAMFLSFVQASVLGLFDATVPVEAEALFGFSSLQIGLVLLARIVPYLGFGHLAGMAVDRYGPRAVASAGFAFLAPCLALLSLPSQKIVTGPGNVVLFCVILALNGLGCSILSSPGIVEASIVVGKYEAANPGLFGSRGPYAQLFGFNQLCFFSGLTFGPLVGGMLKDHFGFGLMGVAFGVLAGGTAVLSLLFIGE